MSVTMNATEAIAHALYEHFGIASDFVGADIVRDIGELVGGHACEFVAIHKGRGWRSVAIEAKFAGIRRTTSVSGVVEVVQAEHGELQSYSVHRGIAAYQRDGLTDQDVLDYC